MTGVATAIVGGAVIGGVASGRAADKAASAQTRGAEAAIAEQRRQFNITQQNLQPFTQTGRDAINQQRILLGLGALPETLQPAGADIGQFGGFDSSLQQQRAQQQDLQGLSERLSGGGVVSGALGRLTGQLGQNLQPGIDILQGEQDTEQSAIDQRNAALGTPEEQQAAAFAAFGESPGQKFLRDRAQKNLLRNTAAIGGLGGGNVRSALVEQGVGFAQQDFQNQFARLGQLAGQGQAATTNVGQFGQATAGNISNLLQAQGQARASGIAGQNAAFQQGLGGVLGGLAQGGAFSPPPPTGGGSVINQGTFNQGAGVDFSQFGFSDSRLKNNKVHRGTENGFNVYSWDWNKAANKLGLFGSGFGAMADEVKVIMPEAIRVIKGFMQVDYNMIGVQNG